MRLPRVGLTPAKREAHQILDLVKAGVYVHHKSIRWALVVLGDAS